MLLIISYKIKKNSLFPAKLIKLLSHRIHHFIAIHRHNLGNIASPPVIIAREPDIRSSAQLQAPSPDISLHLKHIFIIFPNQKAIPA